MVNCQCSTVQDNFEQHDSIGLTGFAMVTYGYLRFIHVFFGSMTTQFGVNSSECLSKATRLEQIEPACAAYWSIWQVTPTNLHRGPRVTSWFIIPPNYDPSRIPL